MQSAGGESVKKLILKVGFIADSALILLAYALVHIVNPILLNTHNYIWLIILIIIENIIYKTFEICTVVYLGYSVYYFIDRKRTKI